MPFLGPLGIFSHYVQNYNHLMRPKLISEFIEKCFNLSRNNLIIRFYIDTKYLASLLNKAVKKIFNWTPSLLLYPTIIKLSPKYQERCAIFI